VPEWIYRWEAKIISIVPAYTLEALDMCDIDRLLPFYHANTSRDAEKNDNPGRAPEEYGNIVYRDGKAYRKVRPQDSAGLKNM
jgi:hypothetical protein